jgi:hypothetical protein
MRLVELTGKFRKPPWRGAPPYDPGEAYEATCSTAIVECKCGHRWNAVQYARLPDDLACPACGATEGLSTKSQVTHSLAPPGVLIVMEERRVGEVVPEDAL